jgi:tetratricopeptide (TPR) repeat protein
LPRAEQVYRQILQVDSSIVQAWYLLGTVNQVQGKLAESVANYQQALRLKPDYAEVLNNLGLALRNQGRLDEAMACYRRALHFKPDSAETLNNLGNEYQAQGQLEEAVACYRQALHLKPDSAEALNNLGNALQEQRQLDEAVACFHQALQLKPDSVCTLTNLGNALQEQRQFDEAVACYHRALRIQPDHADALNNLGNALQAQGQLDEAVACYRHALRLDPTYAIAVNNLGSALQAQADLDEAVVCYRQALHFKPDYADALNNLGNALQAQGKPAEALECYHQVLRLKPDHAQAHLGRALIWLQGGDFEQGLPEFEWRWKGPESSRPHFQQPPWDGTPLDGRAILLHADQGLGDTLQFIRYAPLVQQRGGRVIVACQSPLVRLLASCPGIEQVIARDDPLPRFEVHAALTSLPRIFGTKLASVPAEVGYVAADAALVAHWRNELGPIRGFKIGIAWQGNPQHRRDRHRSFRLAQFEPLARFAEVRLFSLQKGPGAEQLGEPGHRLAVTDLGGRFDDFMDTAAAMSSLDLVITPDTSLAHLAGALGLPAWVALPLGPDWRWLERREDSPWYPTLRLFRQQKWGDWDEVFARIADALAMRLRTEESSWAP